MDTWRPHVTPARSALGSRWTTTPPSPTWGTGAQGRLCDPASTVVQPRQDVDDGRDLACQACLTRRLGSRSLLVHEYTVCALVGFAQGDCFATLFNCLVKDVANKSDGACSRGDGRAGLLANGAAKRDKETSQRVRPGGVATESGGVSRPGSLKCAETTSMRPTASTDSPSTRSTLVVHSTLSLPLGMSPT